MLDDLAPEEVCAIVHLAKNVDGNEGVFIGDTMHMLDTIPGMDTLLEKVQQAGEREDVKTYIEETYGTKE